MAVQFLLSGRAAVPKSKQIINLEAVHLEPGCCTSDTAVATNCALQFPQIRWAPVPKWFASTKR